MLRSCRWTSYLGYCELQIVYGFVWILFVVRNMEVGYLTTTTIQIKPNIICNSHQLGLEVGRPERSTTFSFSAILHDKEIFLRFRHFFSLHIQSPRLCLWIFLTVSTPLQIWANTQFIITYNSELVMLIHKSLESSLWDISDQTPHDAVSNQGIHCVLTECSIEI